MTTLTQRMNVVEENLQSIRLTLDTLLQNLLNPALMVPGTLRFGGNAMQLDNNGIQMRTLGSAKTGFYITDQFVSDPESLTEYGYINGDAHAGVDARMAIGAKATTNGLAEVNFASTATKRTAGITGLLGLSRTDIAQITANKNNWAIGTLDTIHFVSSDAARDVTGIVPPSISDSDSFGLMPILIFVNTGAQDIVFKDESASSDAANRFALKADITLAADGGVAFLYDRDNNRWRCFGTY